MATISNDSIIKKIGFFGVFSFALIIVKRPGGMPFLVLNIFQPLN